MGSLYLTYINGKDIARLEMSDAEILEAVEQSLVAQRNGQTVIEPRVRQIPVSLSDIALGHAILNKATQRGLGQKLAYA